MVVHLTVPNAQVRRGILRNALFGEQVAPARAIVRAGLTWRWNQLQALRDARNGVLRQHYLFGCVRRMGATQLLHGIMEHVIRQANQVCAALGSDTLTMVVAYCGSRTLRNVTLPVLRAALDGDYTIQLVERGCVEHSHLRTGDDCTNGLLLRKQLTGAPHWIHIWLVDPIAGTGLLRQADVIFADNMDIVWRDYFMPGNTDRTLPKQHAILVSSAGYDRNLRMSAVLREQISHLQPPPPGTIQCINGNELVALPQTPSRWPVNHYGVEYFARLRSAMNDE